MNKLKIVMNVYMGLLVILAIISVVFMTPYYDLYVFGNADTYEVYKLMQVFNHGMLNAAIVLAIIALIAKALDFGKDNFGLPAIVCSWVLTLVSLVSLVPLVVYLRGVIPQYVGLDFSVMWYDYSPKLTMINFASVMCALVIVIGFGISIYSSYVYKREKVMLSAK